MWRLFSEVGCGQLCFYVYGWDMGLELFFIDQSYNIICISPPNRETKMIYSKNSDLANRIRKDQREMIFNKIRLELTQFNKVSQANYHLTADGQHDILHSILNYKQDQEKVQSGQRIQNHQKINFKAINNYICQFQGNFIQEFTRELITTVLRYFNNQSFAIASIANLLFKLPSCELLAGFDTNQLIQQIAQSNLQGNNLKNAKVITFFWFSLMRKRENIAELTPITKYYSTIVDSLGIYNILTLLLFSEMSFYRELLPPRDIIVMYLISDINYQEISEQMLNRLCDILENYIRYAQDSSLYHLFSDWIEKRLRERKFPMKLKINLIKLITMMINARNNNSFSMELANLSIFKEVILLSRFGQLQIKMCSLECILTLVDSLNLCNAESSFYDFIEQNQIIEILVYSFDLNLQTEMIFKTFACLYMIFQANKEYKYALMKKAHNFGLMKHLYKFNKLMNSRKTLEITDLICNMYQQQ